MSVASPRPEQKQHDSSMAVASTSPNLFHNPCLLQILSNYTTTLTSLWYSPQATRSL